jgi:hypothetical protein
MYMLAISFTKHTGIRFAEVGFALAAIAGGLLVFGALAPGGRRTGMFLAGVALAAAGVLLVLATRWGRFG